MEKKKTNTTTCRRRRTLTPCAEQVAGSRDVGELTQVTYLLSGSDFRLYLRFLINTSVGPKHGLRLVKTEPPLTLNGATALTYCQSDEGYLDHQRQPAEQINKPHLSAYEATHRNVENNTGKTGSWRLTERWSTGGSSPLSERSAAAEERGEERPRLRGREAAFRSQRRLWPGGEVWRSSSEVTLIRPGKVTSNGCVYIVWEAREEKILTMGQNCDKSFAY